MTQIRAKSQQMWAKFTQGAQLGDDVLRLTKLCGAANNDIRSGTGSDQFTVSDDEYLNSSSPEPLFREEFTAEELGSDAKLPLPNKLPDMLPDIQEVLREETDPLETESQLIQGDFINVDLCHF